MNKGLYITIAVLVIVISGIVIFSATRPASENMVEDVSKVVLEEDMTSSYMPNSDSEQDVVVVEQYIDYSNELVASEDTEKKIIFFHAKWCPTCRRLDKDINENLSGIPADTIILKADYDKETELKKKYKVTIQHTLVQVDKDGKMMNKWTGSPTLIDMLSKIK